MKINEVTPIFVDVIPSILKEGIIYISYKYEIAIHLCACGCNKQVVTPFGANAWTLTTDNGITLRPSIGNFKGENPYHAHYYITNGKIEWL